VSDFDPSTVVPTALNDMPLIALETAGAGEHLPSPGPGRQPWAAAVVATSGQLRAVHYDLGAWGRGITDHLLSAPGHLNMYQLVRSAAFESLGNPLPADTAVVVVSPLGGYAGVLIGEPLHEIAHAAQVRAIIDARPFATTADAPLIIRRCEHEEGAIRCGQVRTFERRPSALPECPDDGSVPAHTFEWRR
jgi:hypothetical protein